MYVEFAFATPSVAAVAPRDAWFGREAGDNSSSEISTIVVRTGELEVRSGYDDENGHARLATASSERVAKTSGAAFVPIVMKTGMYLAFTCAGAIEVTAPVRRPVGGTLACEGFRREGGPEKGVMTFDAFTAHGRKARREIVAAHMTGS